MTGTSISKIYVHVLSKQNKIIRSNVTTSTVESLLPVEINKSCPRSILRRFDRRKQTKLLPNLKTKHKFSILVLVLNADLYT